MTALILAVLLLRLRLTAVAILHGFGEWWSFNFGNWDSPDWTHEELTSDAYPMPVIPGPVASRLDPFTNRAAFILARLACETGRVWTGTEPAHARGIARGSRVQRRQWARTRRQTFGLAA